MTILSQKDAVLLVIDFQEKLFPVIEENERVAAAAVKLIKGCRSLDIPIIVTQQYTRGLGETIPEIKEALGDTFSPLEKISFSCVDAPVFRADLIHVKRSQVIICGIETHICVQQTALDLCDPAKGFEIFLACDAIASRRHSDRDTAITRMSHAGVEMMTVESILFELMRSADHAAFKQISSVVKG